MATAVEKALAAVEAYQLEEAEKHHKLKCPKCNRTQSAKNSKCRNCGHDLTEARKAKFANLNESQLLEANVGWEKLIAALVATGLSPEQAEAVLAKNITKANASKTLSGRAEGRQGVAAEMKRLSNGQWAPKGQGQILRPGMTFKGAPAGDGKILAVGDKSTTGVPMAKDQIEVERNGEKFILGIEPGSANLQDKPLDEDPSLKYEGMTDDERKAEFLKSTSTPEAQKEIDAKKASAKPGKKSPGAAEGGVASLSQAERNALADTLEMYAESVDENLRTDYDSEGEEAPEDFPVVEDILGDADAVREGIEPNHQDSWEGLLDQDIDDWATPGTSAVLAKLGYIDPPAGKKSPGASGATNAEVQELDALHQKYHGNFANLTPEERARAEELEAKIGVSDAQKIKPNKSDTEFKPSGKVNRKAKLEPAKKAFDDAKAAGASKEELAKLAKAVRKEKMGGGKKPPKAKVTKTQIIGGDEDLPKAEAVKKAKGKQGEAAQIHALPLGDSVTLNGIKVTRAKKDSYVLTDPKTGDAKGAVKDADWAEYHVLRTGKHAKGDGTDVDVLGANDSLTDQAKKKAESENDAEEEYGGVLLRPTKQGTPGLWVGEYPDGGENLGPFKSKKAAKDFIDKHGSGAKSEDDSLDAILEKKFKGKTDSQIAQAAAKNKNNDDQIYELKRRGRKFHMETGPNGKAKLVWDDKGEAKSQMKAAQTGDAVKKTAPKKKAPKGSPFTDDQITDALEKSLENVKKDPESKGKEPKPKQTEGDKKAADATDKLGAATIHTLDEITQKPVGTVVKLGELRLKVAGTDDKTVTVRNIDTGEVADLVMDANDEVGGFGHPDTGEDLDVETLEDAFAEVGDLGGVIATGPEDAPSGSGAEGDGDAGVDLDEEQKGVIRAGLDGIVSDSLVDDFGNSYDTEAESLDAAYEALADFVQNPTDVLTDAQMDALDLLAEKLGKPDSSELKTDAPDDAPDAPAADNPAQTALDAYLAAGGDDEAIITIMKAKAEGGASPTASPAEPAPSPTPPASAPDAEGGSGGDLQPNTTDVRIKTMTQGQKFAMADGSEWVYHKPTAGGEFHIVKPAEGGKAKPLHGEMAPTKVAPAATGEETGSVLPDAPAAGGDDLFDTLSASVEAAKGKKGPDGGPSPNEVMGIGKPSSPNAQAWAQGAYTGKGWTGPSGKPRNFKAMKPAKLLSEWTDLKTAGIPDPTGGVAEQALRAAALMKGVTLPEYD